jgi:hypothetical protein
VARDLDAHPLNAKDARFIVSQRIATPVNRIVSTQPHSADDAAQAILARAAQRATLHSMLQAATSNRVTEILTKADVPALVYKGVALSSVQYTSWRGRESVDVDVLIDPRDVPRAHTALVNNGAARLDGRTSAPGGLFRYHEIEAGYRGLPTTVDLHWRLESPGYLDIPFSELWSHRRRLHQEGLQLWTLPDDATLLVAAVHGTREAWRSLRHMLDVSLLLSGMPSERWQQVTRAASSYGADKSLAVALGVAELCGVERLPAIPGKWPRSMAENFVQAWQERSSELAGGVARSPADALGRRADRWRLAPSPSAAMDSLFRSVIRQVLYKRSWTLTRR